jgi:hypothetical protein
MWELVADLELPTLCLFGTPSRAMEKAFIELPWFQKT